MSSVDGEDRDETFMDVVSVLVVNERLGFASYNSSACRVTCSESPVSLERLEERPIRAVMDVPTDLLWMLQILSLHRPRALLVPSAGSQVLVDVALLCGVEVVLIAPREFDDACIWDLLSILWSNVTPLEWHARISPNKHAMLMALSALLPYLQRCDLLIADVSEIAPTGFLYVDNDTLAALQLLRAERHPMDFQGIGRAKEGLSLLSIVDRTCSVLGRSLLRQWFMLPLREMTELQRRQDVVAFFTEIENQELMTRLRRSLRQLRYPGAIFTKMRAATHTTSDYEALLRCVRGFLQIASALSPCAHVLPTFLRIVASCQSSQLDEMSRLIENAIDFTRDPSAMICRTYVRIRPGYDAELDELRAHGAHLDTILTRVAQAESLELPDAWANCPVVVAFAPQWGYVVTVSADSARTAVTDASLPAGWDLALRTGDGFVFKTPHTRRLDAELGDMRAAVLEREAAAQRRLDARMLELSPALIPLHHCAELDCLMGLAVCAREGRWSRPQLTAEAGVLCIDDGVHPILARTSAPAVPFSLAIRAPSERMCAVTGANGSGKSVLLGAIAQTVFLAHLGSFVPCGRAVIGLTDALLATHRPRADRDAARELQSSFGGELAAMSRVLHGCAARAAAGGDGAARALVVMDEFGKGTLAMDGAALLAAAWRCLAALGARRPVVLLATHHTEAVHPTLVGRRDMQRLEMRTALTAATDERGRRRQQLVHSYHVARDEGGGEAAHEGGGDEVVTHALRFAMQFSIPEMLLKRAQDVMQIEGL